MSEEIKNERIHGTQEYVFVEGSTNPQTPMQRFKQVMQRTFSKELFVGLKVVFIQMAKGPKSWHTVKYPQEKLPIGPRYRAIHKLLKLLESGNERCIGCGLCEKICIAKCIRMETHYNQEQRKEVSEYSINLGRCIFCGYCAEVCPELAIVHGPRFENASEQRAHFVLKDDMLTPIDMLKNQEEFPGFGALSDDADKKVKKTPLAY
jgi:NADH-quinone oxidoreductase subunit I